MPSTPGFGEKLRAVFGLSPTILCLTGLSDGRVRDANDAFLSTSGYTREEILGRTPVELGLWVDPAQRDEGIRLLKTGRTVRGMECRFRVKSGEERVTVLSADIVMFDGEACILSALTDITDRTRAEAALRESERRFMVAFHANPLPMSITSLRDQRHLEVNEAAVRHSGYSREAMLGHSKPELGFWVTTEERDRLLRLLHTEGRVRDLEVTFRTRAGEDRQLLVNSEVITFEGEPAVLSVSLDITERKLYEESLRAANQAKDEFLAMLGHELRNPLGTLTNAVAVLERLSGDETMRHVVAIIGRQTGHLGRLVDDLLARVFDLFVQEPQSLDRSRGGLGLGLALVKRLVELHGGSVAVWSAGPGQGSEFTVRLAAIPAPLAATGGSGGDARPAAARGRRVLVVEDSADARQSLRLLLEMAGHEVEACEDGPSGLARLQAFQPDVALIDLGLPGMDGYAVAREARGRPETRAIRLVAVTGYGQAEDRRRALAAGFDLHVTKPVDASMLDEVLGPATS